MCIEYKARLEGRERYNFFLNLIQSVYHNLKCSQLFQFNNAKWLQILSTVTV